jgi:hypothetical protein
MGLENILKIKTGIRFKRGVFEMVFETCNYEKLTVCRRRRFIFRLLSIADNYDSQMWYVSLENVC